MIAYHVDGENLSMPAWLWRSTPPSSPATRKIAVDASIVRRTSRPLASRPIATASVRADVPAAPGRRASAVLTRASRR